MPRLGYGPPLCFFFLRQGLPPQNLAASSFVTKLASFAGEKKFSSPVPPGCLDFGGMVEGQILKTVDSAIEGGGEGLVLIVGMSPPPPPLPPPSTVVSSGAFCGKPSKAVLCKF